MIDNKNEELFWSIFRNIYLNKLIFSKIKCRCRLLCYSYDEIVFSEWMIINNYLELLKDKVTRGEKLIFNNTWVNVFYSYEKLTRHQPEAIKQLKSRFCYDKLEDDYSLIFSKKGIYEVNSIFNWFKDDYDFYLNLFKNYSNYFQVKHHTSCNNNRETNLENQKELLKENENEKPTKKLPMRQSQSRISVHPLTLKQIINHIIVFDNISAMKVLVDQGYYKRDDEQIFLDFIKSFEIGSLKLAEFIYNNYLNLELIKEKEKDQSLWDLVVFTEENILDVNEENGFNLFLDRFYLMKKIKNNENVITILLNGEIIVKNIKSILSTNLFNINFNILIGFAEIISLLNDQLNFQDQIINTYKPNSKFNDINKSLEEEKGEISILSIQEINQLKLKLIEKNLLNENKPLNQPDWISLKQYLERLYRMLILFTGYSIPENYFLFKLKFSNVIFNFKSMQSIQPRENNKYFIYTLNDGKQLIYNRLFSNYKNEKVQLKSFLENCLKDLNLRNNKYQSWLLFQLILEEEEEVDDNNQELIEYGINNFLIRDEFHCDPFNFSKVKSIKTFDSLYQSIQSKSPNIFPIIDNLKILSSIIHNFELATHFKENYSTQYKMALKTRKFADGTFFKTFDELKFIIHNWLDFKDIIRGNSKFWILDTLKFEKDFNINEFKAFVSCLDNLNSNQENENDNDDDDDNDNDQSLYYANDLEESYYIYQNKQEHLKSGVCKPINIKFIHAINYINGELDFSSLTFENESIYESLFKHIILRCDFKAIDQIISNFGQPQKDEDPEFTFFDIIINILYNEAYEKGNTIVFDYLQDKSKKGFIETKDCYPW
ncbi:hypothetical protein ACTA71_000604 [Dictyostelium dimigraforme]